MRKRHGLARQAADPLAVPTAAGVSNAGITAGTGSTATGLVVDGSVAAGTQPTDVPLVPTSPDDPLSAGSSLSSATSSPAPSGSGEMISTSTVIGACVGAFVGAIALILLGVLLYRRAAKPQRRQPPHRKGPPRPLSHIEAQPDAWTKFEGGYPPETKQITPDSVAPMEKLTMFKKSPSVRTAYTQKSSEDPHSDSHNFGQYHPDLAKNLATMGTQADADADEKQRPTLGRIDIGPTLSWDSQGFGSFNGDDGGRMSPLFNKAIPTPTATSTPKMHQWQSAEVVNYEGEKAEVVQPSYAIPVPPVPVAPEQAHAVDRRKSVNNPFFNAQSEVQLNRVSLQRKKSLASSVASSHYTNYEPPRIDKGKGRAIDPPSSHGHGQTFEDVDEEDDDDVAGYYSAASHNPFRDPDPEDSASVTTLTAPTFVSNTIPPSPSSGTFPRSLPPTPTPVSPTTSEKRAIQGLLAALDIGASGASEDGRASASTSSSPSGRNTVTSVGSNYTEEMTAQFPVPPSRT